MHQADGFTFEGRREPNSVYTGAASSLPGFQAFMNVLSSRPGLLPPWWNTEKQKECEEFGESGANWSSLKKQVTKADVIEHYGEPKMPMQLRMFAEEVYQRPPPGGPPPGPPGSSSGRGMRALMMAMEGGGGGDGPPFMSMMGL